MRALERLFKSPIGKKIKETCLYGALGVSSGIAGLATVTRCGGGSCPSCLGCAGIGVVVLLIPFCGKYFKKEVEINGKIHGMD